MTLRKVEIDSDQTRSNTGSIRFTLATLFLEDTLNEGLSIEIPSLGVEIYKHHKGGFKNDNLPHEADPQKTL